MVEFEARDVSPVLPARLAVLIAGIALGLALFVWLAFPLGPGDRVIAPAREMPPAPRLEVDAAKDMAAFRAEEQRRLAPLPIDRAMRTLAEKGIKDWPCAGCR